MFTTSLPLKIYRAAVTHRERNDEGAFAADDDLLDAGHIGERFSA